MTDEIPFDRPLSHPPEDGKSGVLLDDHLDEVASRTAAVVPETETPAGTPLSDLGRIVGQLHDVGKLTTYFQQYIAGERSGGQETNHSQLGAALTLYVLTEDGYDVTDSLIAFIAVARHHGRLPNVVDEAVESGGFFDRFHDQLTKQASDIQQHSSAEVRGILDRVGTDATFDDFIDALENDEVVKPLEYKLKGIMFSAGGEDVPAEAHDALLALWSGLLLADKSAAAGINEAALWSGELDPSAIEAEIESIWVDEDGWDDDTHRLNEARDEARETAVSNAQDLPVDGGVATLTLPTGLGKTFAGTQAALEHLQQKRAAGRPGRLVYALPFTSIIDQTEGVFEDVFDADSTSDDLTVHHHLAETVTSYDDDDSEETDEFADREYLLGEMWRSKSVLTTYVQLFESLVAPSNGQALKLSGLDGSVVLLDEPQSLPTDWWPLFRRLVRLLVDQYDATVILMTATQPRLLESEFDTVELVPQYEEYFGEFERVNYRFDESIASEGSELSYGVAADELVTRIEAEDGPSSLLSITNTIDSTVALFDEITARLDDADVRTVDIATAYEDALADRADDLVDSTVASVIGDEDAIATCQLTTRHSPRDRRHLLDAVSRLLDGGQPVFLCSTQLVEAGVDISFEAVYRDLAPLPSLVQAAGRCNRGFEWERGSVTVWQLQSPGDGSMTPAEAVYGRGFNRIHRTRLALDAINALEGRVTEEIITTDGVREYYRELDASDPGDKTLLDQFDDLDCEDLRDASLINASRSIDVYVLRTEQDRRRAARLSEALENCDFDVAEALSTKLAPLRVSIPAYDQTTSDSLRRLPPSDPMDPDSSVRLLDSRDSAEFFDAQSGVQVSNIDATHRLL